MREPLSISLYGCGQRTQQLLDSVFDTGKLKVAACYDINEERAGAAARKYSGRSVYSLDELRNYRTDAFLICLFPAAHKNALLEIAPTGKPIYMEKPIACDVVGALETVDAVRLYNNICHVGFCYRHVPVFKKIIEMIKAGDLGEIISIDQDWLAWQHEPWAGDWRSDPKTGGELLQHCCHAFDVFRQWGGNIVSVMAKTTQVLSPESPSENVANVLFVHENNKTLTNFNHSTVSRYNNLQGRVTGTAMTILYEWNQNSNIKIFKDNKYMGKREPDEVLYFASGGYDKPMMEDFILEAKGEKEVNITVEDGLVTTAITEAIRKSNETGREIKVEDIISDARSSAKGRFD